MIKIGISACFFHPDPMRPVFKGKTLLYIEQTLSHWVNSLGAITFMLPPPSPANPDLLRAMVHEMDGLILHGGADVSPQIYGEKPLQPEWKGDEIRDRYEIKLLNEFLNQKKPILGVCRGAQLLNVAMGGTLYQDIATQVPGALVHRNWEIYDQNFHSIEIKKESLLQKIYAGFDPSSSEVFVNSIHHQAIKKLGDQLHAEAFSKDGIIEAIRFQSETFCYAVQWHPEFHSETPHLPLIDSTPLLKYFLSEVRQRKELASCSV